MNLTRLRGRGAAILAAAVLAAACSSSSNTRGGGSSSSTSSAKNGGKLTATAPGVTADTIKIGFSYPDFVALANAGLVKTDHGPYDEMIKALVDDVNKNGGIGGRKLVAIPVKYSVLANTEQLAACAKLTEDEKVFAVLNGFQADNNLCVVQQHATILIGGVVNSLVLSKARAPWVTWQASDDRGIKALVKALDDNNELKGHTIAVFGQNAANKPLLDVAVKALEDAGHKVVDTALNDAPGDDQQAREAQDKTFAQRLADKHVDVIVVVGQYVPGATFDNAGYHPAFFFDSIGGIAAQAFTNPLAKFPIVGGLAENASQDAPYDVPSMQHCVEVYKQATGKQIVNATQENKLGHSTGFSGMEEACTTLQIFVAAAKAAGPNLTNETFAKAIASLDKVELPFANPGSFASHKPDAQDQFQLMKFNPAYQRGTDIPEFLPIGEPINFTG